MVGNDTYEGGYGTMDGGLDGAEGLCCFPSELILSSSGSGKKILRFVCLLLCMFFKDQDDIHEKKCLE